MLPLAHRSSGILFSSIELRELMERRGFELRDEVEQFEPNRLLNTSPEDLITYLLEKHRLTPPTLRRDAWSASENETKIDVRNDQGRAISDRSQPFFVHGQHIEVEVPFEGATELLYARPSTFGLGAPRAKICGSSIVLGFDLPSDSPPVDIKRSVERALDSIDEYLSRIRNDLVRFENELASTATQAVSGRRERILANMRRAAALGIPLKERPGAPQTFAVPDIRRKIAPTLPPATSAAYEPEPVLEMAHYEHILSVLQCMTQVIERSPSAFSTMGEEDLRQHYLVQLNSQFEVSATGETFNVSGKTDILLRMNGRNVFIAECKFWRGPKQFRETIDQLLRYVAWRDSKTAILVFNRGTALSTVVDGVSAEATAHGNYKRTVDWKHESGFRFVFHHTSDANREFLLTVLVFDVPGASTS